MCLGERIRRSTFVISPSHTIAVSTDAPFLLFVHLCAYLNVCTISRDQVKARVDHGCSFQMHAHTLSTGSEAKDLNPSIVIEVESFKWNFISNLIVNIILTHNRLQIFALYAGNN